MWAPPHMLTVLYCPKKAFFQWQKCHSSRPSPHEWAHPGMERTESQQSSQPSVRDWWGLQLSRALDGPTMLLSTLISLWGAPQPPCSAEAPHGRMRRKVFQELKVGWTKRRRKALRVWVWDRQQPVCLAQILAVSIPSSERPYREVVIPQGRDPSPHHLPFLCSSIQQWTGTN